MLDLHSIYKTFNAGTVNEKTALNGLNLHLNEGDFVTVIGGNGAGKSTMLNAVAGTWFVDEGKITIDDIDVTKLPEHKRAKYLGRVFQDPMTGTAATMQIEENMALAARRGLTPAAVTLAAEEYTAVLENLELLADCGFLCEDFGDGTVLVREVPDDVRAEDAAVTLEELAQKLRLHSADRAALRDEVLHTVACKSAIKAGMTSDPAELRALAAQVQSGAVRYCPHGRPVAVKLREYEIEKMFKRA